MRSAVFDPTDDAVFAAQRENYDWHLLQNSAIHRVNDLTQLDRAESMLSELGYAIHRLDASTWSGHGSIYAAFAAAFDFPHGGGANLDGLNDYLRDVAEFRHGGDAGRRGTAVLVMEYQKLVEVDVATSQIFLGICAESARYASLLGHPLLFLFSCPVPMTQNSIRGVLLDDPLQRGRGGTTGSS